MPEHDKPIVWNAVLAGALSLPGVHVDRSDFLREALAAHATPDQLRKAIALGPARAGIDAVTIQLVARATIRRHHAGVTAASALAGLPGGWWMAGTIPTDLAQYFWHVFVVLQKLAYLYGWPALLERDHEFDEETKLVLTLFVGVMLGAHGASEGLKHLADHLARHAVTHLPRATIGKSALFRTAQEVAKWLGVQLTQRRLAEWVGRAVPVLGGLAAGAVTWLAFRVCTERLLAHLEALPPRPMAHA